MEESFDFFDNISSLEFAANDHHDKQYARRQDGENEEDNEDDQKRSVNSKHSAIRPSQEYSAYSDSVHKYQQSCSNKHFLGGNDKGSSGKHLANSSASTQPLTAKSKHFSHTTNITIDRSDSNSSSDGENDSGNIVVQIHSKKNEDHPSRFPMSRKYISKKNISQKPPLPSCDHSSNWQMKHKHHDLCKKNCNAEEESLSFLAPGSTFYTADGRKMRKGRCKYSDEEVSDSNSNSSDEEELWIDNQPKNRAQHDLNFKLGLGDLVSSRSDCSSSRSQDNSSEWSTGSDKNFSDRENHRPSARLSRRHSSSSENEHHRTRLSGHRSNKSDQRPNCGRSSDSSITVSSLSDTEVPDHTSHDISFPSQAKSTQSSENDRLSLEILLSALLDADKDKSGVSSHRKSVRINVPLQQQKSCKPKANYTFSSDRSRMIDIENQRLLNNILAQRSSRAPQNSTTANANTSVLQEPKAKSGRRRVSPPRRVTNSTVNRMREQQRIERENLALLRRLNQIKPSTEISRSKCLGDYERQIAYHCPDMRTSENDCQSRKNKSSILDMTSGSRKRRPASASYSRPSSSYGADKSCRPSSATVRPSSATTRPTSATTRPKSATTRHPGTKERPEWQSGW